LQAQKSHIAQHGLEKYEKRVGNFIRKPRQPGELFETKKSSLRNSIMKRILTEDDNIAERALGSRDHNYGHRSPAKNTQLSTSIG